MQIRTYVEVELSDFDEQDLVDHLEGAGYSCFKVRHPGASTFDPIGLLELERVEHLSICGLKDDAKIEALQLVSRAIGRDLAH